MAARLPGLRALLLPVCLGSADLSAQEADSVAPARSVSGETLRRAGATRLGDLLLHAPWHVSTVDGFTWQAAPFGGSPFAPAGWLVLVDGRRMDADLFGRLDLDRVGIPLEQIARVDFLDLPRLEAGRLTTEGIVHIHTTTPEPGPSAGAAFATGTEIGDPGPFAFTPLGGENVDRIGHDGSAAAAYGGGSWFASAALGSSERIPTDPAIAGRYLAALGARPRLDATVVSAAAGTRLGGGRHRLTLRHSSLGAALGLSPFGTELATRERFTQLGLGGTVAAGSGGTLAYDLAHSLNRARRRHAGPGPLLDWDARTTEGQLELSRPGSRLGMAGLRLRRLAVRTPADLDHPTITLATAYAQAGLASAAVTYGEGEVGLALALARIWSLAPGSTLEGVIGYERTARAEANSIWAWTERGYRLLEEAGADVAVAGTRRAPERISADTRWSFRPHPGVGGQVRALYRRERRLSLERRRLHFVPDIESFDGPATIVHGAGGDLVGAAMDVQVRAGRTLIVRASYWYGAAVAGDSSYREARATVPRHGARLTSELTPVRGLDLWLAATYRSASRWEAFQAVEAESGGRYRARLAPAVTLDLAVQKWLWGERLRAHFGVHNLFGADLRYHPAGAAFAPAALVQLEGWLP